MNKKLNLEIGTKFGKWEIISDETTKLNNLTNWKCRCECGFETFIPLNNLMNGSSTQCKSCSATESGLKRRKGCGDISGEMWSIIKTNATKSGKPFNLRVEEAWDRFEYQKGKCALTDDKIELSGYPYDKEKTTAILTLINEDLDYSIDNIIWIHKRVSDLKNKLSLDEFLDIVHKVATNYVKKEVN